MPLLPPYLGQLTLVNVHCAFFSEEARSTLCSVLHVSYSLNSLEGGYIRDYIRDYERGYEGGY